jgi:hypothetical protein
VEIKKKLEERKKGGKEETKEEARETYYKGSVTLAEIRADVRWRSPSEAFDVIKYRDNSCEMKKISFIQTTKYNEYT